METDLLIDDLMATSSDTRYRAVDSNGLLSEHGSSTDDEMLDITTTAPVDYSDLADRSQGTVSISLFLSEVCGFHRLIQTVSLKVKLLLYQL